MLVETPSARNPRRVNQTKTKQQQKKTEKRIETGCITLIQNVFWIKRNRLCIKPVNWHRKADISKSICQGQYCT